MGAHRDLSTEHPPACLGELDVDAVCRDETAALIQVNAVVTWTDPRECQRVASSGHDSRRLKRIKHDCT
jgi:hypothetical protein